MHEAAFSGHVGVVEALLDGGAAKEAALHAWHLVGAWGGCGWGVGVGGVGEGTTCAPTDVNAEGSGHGGMTWHVAWQ